MSERALVLHKAEPFQVPAIIADVGPEATKRFFEFFTVPIRNKNTRSAYYQAIGQFLDWCQRAGFSNIEDIEPIHVAAYIEQHSGLIGYVRLANRDKDAKQWSDFLFRYGESGDIEGDLAGLSPNQLEEMKSQLRRHP